MSQIGYESFQKRQDFQAHKYRLGGGVDFYNPNDQLRVEQRQATHEVGARNQVIAELNAARKRWLDEYMEARFGQRFESFVDNKVEFSGDELSLSSVAVDAGQEVAMTAVVGTGVEMMMLGAAIVSADKNRSKIVTPRKVAAIGVGLGLFGLWLVGCGGAVTPEQGVNIVQPTQAAQSTEVQGGEQQTQPTAVPTSTAEAKASATPVIASGETREPGYVYPTRFMSGEVVTGQQAMDGIALSGTDERVLFEAELVSMGTDAPTSDRVLALNTTDKNNPSWTYLPGNEQRLYMAVVREGGAEKVDPSLHDWRVGNVSGVELVRWQEVTPPPGTDNLRLIANGSTTVIGAFQGDTLVYWFSTEHNNGQGDWLPNDSNMPVGAGEYSFDNDRKTWVTRVGDSVFEYRSGNWNEVIDLGTVRDGQWWDGAGWQGVPEGWQVSVGGDGVVRAVDADGVQYVYEISGWIKASESYRHITVAPDGSALQEYLNASGARVQPAIHLGNGAFELVPAGAVLPTHIYEPETGNWREVDPNKAIIDEVDTSTWFTAIGSAGTIYEGLQMPMRVTTTDVSTLREIEYSTEVQEYFMVNWLRMCHVAHTYQQRGRGETVDFETYVAMVKAGDPDAQIYVYRYDLNPDGSRGTLRQQMVNPGKGVTIQAVYDREFENNPLATVTNPNNAQPGVAFILGATDAGQAAVAINTDADWFDATGHENEEDRLRDVVMSGPFNGMMWVAMYATSYTMQNPDANTDSFTLQIEDVNEAVDAAIDYSQDQLGIQWKYPYPEDLVSVKYD